MSNKLDTPAYLELRRAAQLILSKVRTPFQTGKERRGEVAPKKRAYRVGHGVLLRLEQALSAADEEVKSVPNLRVGCELCGERVRDIHQHQCKKAP